MMKTTVFGGSGLLGTALFRTSSGKDVLSLTSKDVDLRDARSCEDKLSKSDHNDVWINCAARVGGVKANTDFVADFYQDNIQMINNVFHNANKLNVGKMVSVLSTCIYPDAQYVNYPITEDQLHNGPPHVSNYGYAYAKRMLDVSSRAYRQQYGKNYVTVVPNNLYGLNDNYDLNNSHVIPALIRKFYESHVSGSDVVIWGSGKPLREFTFSDDAARIMWWVVENYDETEPVNIGNTEEVSIADVAHLISKIMGFKNKIVFDTSKPEGQFRKPTSNQKLKKLGCNIPYTPLEKGLEVTIDHFVRNYENSRGMR